MKGWQTRDPRWSEDEIALAAGLAEELDWSPVAQTDPQVIALSQLLQHGPAPSDARTPAFRSPAAVARKIRALCALYWADGHESGFTAAERHIIDLRNQDDGTYEQHLASAQARYDEYASEGIASPADWFIDVSLPTRDPKAIAGAILIVDALAHSDAIRMEHMLLGCDLRNIRPAQTDVDFLNTLAFRWNAPEPFTKISAAIKSHKVPILQGTIGSVLASAILAVGGTLLNATVWEDDEPLTCTITTEDETLEISIAPPSSVPTGTTITMTSSDGTQCTIQYGN